MPGTGEQPGAPSVTTLTPVSNPSNPTGAPPSSEDQQPPVVSTPQQGLQAGSAAHNPSVDTTSSYSSVQPKSEPMTSLDQGSGLSSHHLAGLTSHHHQPPPLAASAPHDVYNRTPASAYDAMAMHGGALGAGGPHFNHPFSINNLMSSAEQASKMEMKMYETMQNVYPTYSQMSPVAQHVPKVTTPPLGTDNGYYKPYTPHSTTTL